MGWLFIFTCVVGVLYFTVIGYVGKQEDPYIFFRDIRVFVFFWRIGFEGHGGCLSNGTLGYMENC